MSPPKIHQKDCQKLSLSASFFCIIQPRQKFGIRTRACQLCRLPLGPEYHTEFLCGIFPHYIKHLNVENDTDGVSECLGWAGALSINMN